MRFDASTTRAIAIGLDRFPANYGRGQLTFETCWWCAEPAYIVTRRHSDISKFAVTELEGAYGCIRRDARGALWPVGPLHPACKAIVDALGGEHTKGWIAIADMTAEQRAELDEILGVR